MFKDKYPSMFSVYYPSNIFRNTRSFENWRISLRYSQVLARHIQSRDAIRPIARERKYLMGYKLPYLLIDVAMVLSRFLKGTFPLFGEVIKTNQVTEMNGIDCGVIQGDILRKTISYLQ